MSEVRICPNCQEEMALRYEGVLFMKTGQFAPSPDYIRVELEGMNERWICCSTPIWLV